MYFYNSIYLFIPIKYIIIETSYLNQVHQNEKDLNTKYCTPYNAILQSSLVSFVDIPISQ